MGDEDDRPRLIAVPAPRRLYRIAYEPDVTALPAWRWQSGGSRWDDPEIARVLAVIEQSAEGALESAETRQKILADVLERRGAGQPFRVLYTADTRVTAFIEKLQDYRRSTTALSRGVLEEIRRVSQDDPTVKIVAGVHTGIVPAAHLDQLYVGELRIEPASFADVEEMRSIQFLRAELLDEARRLGLSDVTRGEILGDHRAFTQLVARAIHRAPDAFVGIHHDSTHGRPYGNWAIFDGRADTTLIATAKVRIDDPDLQRAVEVLDIEIEGAPAQLRQIEAEREVREADRGTEEGLGPSIG